MILGSGTIYVGVKNGILYLDAYQANTPPAMSTQTNYTLATLPYGIKPTRLQMFKASLSGYGANTARLYISAVSGNIVLSVSSAFTTAQELSFSVSCPLD